MRLKKRKYSFFLSEVEYLGHCIVPDGLKPSPSKVEVIVAAPLPTDVSQLKAFLGLVNYYGRFLTNLASTLAPLYKLLRKHACWMWKTEHESAFQKIKDQLKSDAVAEVKYAQLDKEGLAIIFGLKKFQHYLHGKHFIVYTDHKPLTHIFNPARAIPVMASARIQRWALTIGAYDYEIQFKPGP